MEALEILVGDVFNAKETYREGDYLVIMDILKEAYHVLKGDYGYFIADKELEITTDDEEDEDEIIARYTTWESATDGEDTDEETYTGTYIESY
tara:strand:+ start:1078 stop:1356 length:279 start_codon:yes stop_codon:yes gene_type:complete